MSGKKGGEAGEDRENEDGVERRTGSEVGVERTKKVSILIEKSSRSGDLFYTKDSEDDKKRRNERSHSDYQTTDHESRLGRAGVQYGSSGHPKRHSDDQPTQKKNIDSRISPTTNFKRGSSNADMNKPSLPSVKERGERSTSVVSNGERLTSVSNQKSKKTTHAEMIKLLIAMQTEYVDNLDRLIKVFVRPLSEHHLTSKYRHVIFSNVKEIYSVHVSLQSDLECLEETDVVGIAKAISAHRNDLEVHAEYNYNLPKALNKLEELKVTEPKVHSLIFSGEIPSLRLRPILSAVPDIVTGYINLLKKLLKAVEKEREELTHVEGALICTRDINEHIDIKVKDLEIKEGLTKIQQEISVVDWKGNSLEMDYGRLLLNEAVHIKRKTSAIEKSRRALLLDKVLIITKPLVNGSYVFEQALGVSQIGSIDETRNEQVRIEKADGESLTLSLNSQTDSKRWFKALSKAREIVCPKEAADENHFFTLCTFKNLQQCDACKMLLKGYYSQGYYCTRTYKKAHLECLEQCKRVSSRGKEDKTVKDPTLSIPVSPPNAETQKKFFGGYIGQVGAPLASVQNSTLTNSQIKERLLEAVQRKLTLLKTGVLQGGFRYITIELCAANPSSPACFIMWESKNKGRVEQKMPKTGFIERMYKQLNIREQKTALADIEELVHQYHGQMNSYSDMSTGEWYLAGYHQELEETISSDEEEAVDEKNNYPDATQQSLKGNRLGQATAHNSTSSAFREGKVTPAPSHKFGLFEDNSYTGRIGMRKQPLTADFSKNQTTASQQKKTSSRLSQNSATFNIARNSELNKK